MYEFSFCRVRACLSRGFTAASCDTIAFKPHEEQFRNETDQGTPFTLVTSSGERVGVRSHDYIDLPPLQDQEGNELSDGELETTLPS